MQRMLIIEAGGILDLGRRSIVCLPLHRHANFERCVNGQAQEFLAMFQTCHNGALQALDLIRHVDILHTRPPVTCMGRIQIAEHVASF